MPRTRLVNGAVRRDHMRAVLAASVVGILMLAGFTTLAQSQTTQSSGASQSDPATKRTLGELQRQIEELRQRSEASTKLCQSLQMLAQDPTPAAGRYRIVMRDGIRADTFLLDTVDGRVWRPRTYTDVEGGPQVWVLENRFDSDTDQTAWEIKKAADGLIKPAPAAPPK